MTNAPQIDDHVTVRTPTGPITGLVIGSENRDASRSGTGQPQPFICVATGEDRRWFPAAAVQSIASDPVRDQLAGLVKQVGRHRIEQMLGQL